MEIYNFNFNYCRLTEANIINQNFEAYLST